MTEFTDEEKDRLSKKLNDKYGRNPFLGMIFNACVNREIPDIKRMIKLALEVEATAVGIVGDSIPDEIKELHKEVGRKSNRLA